MKKIYVLYTRPYSTIAIKEMNNEQHATNYVNKITNALYEIVITNDTNSTHDIDIATQRLNHRARIHYYKGSSINRFGRTYAYKTY